MMKVKVKAKPMAGKNRRTRPDNSTLYGMILSLRAEVLRLKMEFDKVNAPCKGEEDKEKPTEQKQRIPWEAD